MALTKVNTTHADKVKVVNGYMKPFWLEPSNKDVMGYMLQGVEAGDWIPQGYPVKCEDGANGQKVATLCKYMAVAEFVTTKKVKVRRNSLAKVGEKYAVEGGTTALEVFAIERAGEYDLVEFKNTHGITSGTTPSLYLLDGENPVLPNRVVAEDCNMIEDDKTIVAAHSGIVLKNVVNYPAEYYNTTAFPGTVMLVGCPHITFVNQ